MRNLEVLSHDILKLIRLIEKKIKQNKKINIKNYMKKYKKLLNEVREIEEQKY